MKEDHSVIFYSLLQKICTVEGIIDKRAVALVMKLYGKT